MQFNGAKLQVGCLAIWLAISGQPVVVAENSSLSSPAELAKQIDSLLEESWSGKSVVPAPTADDAEFLRRVSLDLIGRVPAVSEVRAFLADRDPGKRQRLVDALLADPRFVKHLAHVWRAVLLSQANPQDVRYLAPKLEAWLSRQLRDEVAYDAWVRQLVTAPLDAPPSSRLDPDGNVERLGIAFFQANELKPENIASATARIFLGVNLDCAQCHNHPFADWKQEQFWQFAAFFAGVERLRPDNSFMAAPEVLTRRKLKIVGTEKVASATFLDGQTPAWSPQQSPRQVLADWLTSQDNPYFARAIANRTWAHFFGRGLVEPIDGLGGRNQPSHAELLGELAQQLVDHNFDLKFLMRSITATAAYNRTSRLTDPSQHEAERFARMAVRGLTPEQVFDSLAVATGFREIAAHSSSRAEYLNKFASLDRPIDTQTSIVQALTLMNGKFALDATTLSTSETLAAVVDSPFLDRSAKVESLLLAALSRLPTAQEAEELSKFVADYSGSPADALGDILWTLLNSSEFILNH